MNGDVIPIRMDIQPHEWDHIAITWRDIESILNDSRPMCSIRVANGRIRIGTAHDIDDAELHTVVVLGSFEIYCKTDEENDGIVIATIQAIVRFYLRSCYNWRNQYGVAGEVQIAGRFGSSSTSLWSRTQRILDACMEQIIDRNRTNRDRHGNVHTGYKLGTLCLSYHKSISIDACQQLISFPGNVLRFHDCTFDDNGSTLTTALMERSKTPSTTSSQPLSSSSMVLSKLCIRNTLVNTSAFRVSLASLAASASASPTRGSISLLIEEYPEDELDGWIMIILDRRTDKLFTIEMEATCPEHHPKIQVALRIRRDRKRLHGLVLATQARELFDQSCAKMMCRWLCNDGVRNHPDRLFDALIDHSVHILRGRI
eukprot:CAMPEP_0119548320 /NCGR_PEP_ID=MMETSP1352-20130426/2267_1 /TAXON_ID=265584 /ORGANISM="Stauroneis constricta, Strain CCMP1120" /LENGTH=370 /DNA_ID=CAMNT_0007593551 /DNA_START=164 /DNA_END=1276 /DNA_ORIENTATION=-